MITGNISPCIDSHAKHTHKRPARRQPESSALLAVELHLDLSDLAAQLQAMAQVLEAVEEERDLSDLPAAPLDRISKPQPES